MVMEYYQEETEDNGRLYNRDVLRLLFSYILRYRKYLVISLLFVFLIAGASLTIPFLFKTIVDRYIFKQGRVVDRTMFTDGLQKSVSTGRRRSVILTDSEVFMFRSDLKLFSRREKEELIESGALSSKSYVLIETRTDDPKLDKKIMKYVQQGSITSYGEGIYLFETSTLNALKVSEIALLREVDFSRIVQFIVLVMGILLMQFVASYLQIIFLMRLSQNAMRDLRRDLFAHILSRNVTYYDRNPIGKLVNRVTNDIERLNELFSSVLVTFFQDILMLLGITVIMFFTSVTLASVSYTHLTLPTSDLV